MSQTLDKRTVDDRQYDIDCSKFLAPDETIVSIIRVTADQGALVFGTPAANNVPASYPDGSTAAIGKAVQVRISVGVISSGQPFLVCTVRAVVLTNLGNTLEATVLLRLVDTVGI